LGKFGRILGYALGGIAGILLFIFAFGFVYSGGMRIGRVIFYSLFLGMLVLF
jgi:hypothetical protein